MACRPQIIDPFVEVEIIGLPIDCCKEQTRVVDDNGKGVILLISPSSPLSPYILLV